MKILLIHPGHTFSTSDVFDGLLAGLTACGAEVIPYRWDRYIQTLGSMVLGAIHAEVVKSDKQDAAAAFMNWLAAADVTNIAIDQEIDAALVVNGTLFPPSRTKPLAKLGIPICCYGTEAPYFHDTETAIAPFYAFWFTQERASLPHFQRVMDGRAAYLPMAYHPENHVPPPPDPEYTTDVVFVGGGYPERRALLDGVDWTGIQHERRGTLWHLDLEAERAAADAGRAVRYAEGAITNTATRHWHANARIALNIHRRMTHVESDLTIAPGTAESLGPRAYEIPAVGGFMLCDDDRPELAEVFGESAATFRAWDSADLERQIRYWLAHPDERERRRRAQHEAVQPHTWTARARQVLETIFA